MMASTMVMAQLAPPGSHHTIAITPPWPGLPYTIACTRGTTREMCDRFASSPSASRMNSSCDEPERDTAEVYNSLLAGSACHASSTEPCLVVDIGCNLGLFANQAAALGATVECFEAQPHMIDAIQASAQINGWSARLKATHGAVFTTSSMNASSDTMVHLSGGFRPCSLKHDRIIDPWSFSAPRLALGPMLASRSLTLLKVDIDSFDGALLHEAVALIRTGETRIRHLLIEIGATLSSSRGADRRKYPIACRQPEVAHSGHPLCPTAIKPAVKGRLSRNVSSGDSSRSNAVGSTESHPRGGDVDDLWVLHQTLGYDLWRTNVHVNREILDHRGVNVNTRMSDQHPDFEPFHYVRGMRKVERLKRSTPRERYASLFGWGQSVLATRDNLLEPLTTHHGIDVGLAGATQAQLNGIVTR